MSHNGAYCAIIEPSVIFASGASFSMTSKAAISVTKGKTYTLDYNLDLQPTTLVATRRFLISSAVPAYYEVRATLVDTAATNLFSIGNVSMKLNRGDFDENNGGYPDSADFVEMRKAMIDHEEATENAKAFAEMNADGVVNSKDLVRMKLYGARMK